MMSGINLQGLSDALGAELVAPQASNEILAKNISALSIDTRSLQSGDVYLALKGERFDGHEFVKQAIEKDCSALIVDHLIDGVSVPQLLVADTAEALSQAGGYNRDLFSGSVIGLTGSSGKTSTKEILKHLLSAQACTMATEGNFNNEVGVPLTLLKMSEEDQFAVVEMGARALGDISKLVRIVRPNVAILLNAGQAHIDIFGSYENIVKAKGEIYQGLGDKGVAIVNFDDPARDKWLADLTGQRVLTFSLESDSADVFASDIVYEADRSVFELHYGAEQLSVLLPLPGRHNIQNTLAAVAAALSLNIGLKDLVIALSTLDAPSGRLKKYQLQGIDLIDDSYNANPASVKAATDVLAMQKHFKVLVLAEMAELGELEEKLHLEVAQYVAESDIDLALFVGKHAHKMAATVGERALDFKTKEELVKKLNALIDDKLGREHVTVLVKGSRSTKMEDVVEIIEKRAA